MSSISDAGQKKRKLNVDGYGYVRVVGEGLRTLIGGVKLCREEARAAGVLEITWANRRGEGLGGSDCTDDGGGELRSGAGGGRWKQKQCACSERGY